MSALPKQVSLYEKKQYRIIPSVFPSINFFEGIVDAAEMETLWEIEALTNERIRQELGDIFLVPEQDRVFGAGASIIMAAFTHTGRPSRFSDGSYGVYYAGLSVETAIRETVYHRELFLRATKEEPGEITMRLYEGTIKKSLHDIRARQFDALHHSNDYTESQVFGKKMRALNSWGLIYHSVRHDAHCCIAVFRPPAISNPVPKGHLRYVWNGERVSDIFNIELIAYE